MTIAFGGTFVATKVALRGFEPLLIAFVRFVVAGAILWLVWRRRSEREAVTRRELGRLAALGFVSLTVYFAFENVGIAHTSASDAAILIATVPIFVLIVNAVTTREHTSGGQWLGVALSFAGVVALVELGARGVEGTSLGGDLLVLAASLAGAVYTVMARRLLVTRSALFVTTFQNLFGALFMAPLALVEAAAVGVRTPTAAAVSADMLGENAAVVIEGVETHTRTGFMDLKVPAPPGGGGAPRQTLHVPLTHVKVFGWYDNEMGSYTQRLGELTTHMAENM